MRASRQLAPWLESPAIEAVGQVTERKPPEARKRSRLTFGGRRRQLLDASLAAFVSHGLDLTTMDTIAAQAGVSKPLVYRHFPNRFEALLAVVNDQADKLLATLSLESGPTLAQLIESYLHYAEDSPAGFRFLFQVVNGSPGAARRRVQALRTLLEEAVLGAVLREAAASPDLADSARASGVGTLLLSILEGVGGSLRDGDDAAGRAMALRKLLDPTWILGAMSDSPREIPELTDTLFPPGV
jgi:AcrR family transcriptional regulator